MLSTTTTEVRPPPRAKYADSRNYRARVPANNLFSRARAVLSSSSVYVIRAYGSDAYANDRSYIDKRKSCSFAAWEKEKKEEEEEDAGGGYRLPGRVCSRPIQRTAVYRAEGKWKKCVSPAIYCGPGNVDILHLSLSLFRKRLSQTPTGANIYKKRTSGDGGGGVFVAA